MQIEQLGNMFEESEINALNERAETEGWKEKFDRIRLQPAFKLMELEKRIDKVTQGFETRLTTLKNFVVSHEENTGTTEPGVSPEVLIAEQKEKLTQSFRQELAGGDDFDITDPKDWKGSVALVAFDWLQESKKAASDPDANHFDRIKAGFMSFLGGIGMKMFAGANYEKYEKSLNGLSNGIPDVQTNTGEENSKTNDSKENQVENAVKYSTGINILLGLSKDDAPESYNILNSTSIRDQSYNTLGISSLQESEGLGAKYGFEGRDDEVFETLSLLQGKEKYFDSFFKNQENFDWKNESIETVILEFYKFGKIFEKLKDVSMEDLLKGKFDIFSIKTTEGEPGVMDELLHARKNDPASKLNGVDDKFLATIYLNKSTAFGEDFLLGLPGANQEFITDFIHFKDNLGEMIGKEFFAGKDNSKESFQEYFNDYPYTQKDVLQLYILSNGATDSLSLNDMEKGLMFMKISKLMGLSPLRGETYGYAIKEAVKGNNDFLETLPPSLLNTIKNIAEKTAMNALNQLYGFAGEIWGTLNGKEKGMLIAGLGTVGALSFYLGKVMIWSRGAITTASAIAIAGIVGKIYDIKKDEPEFKSKLKKGNITSKDNFVEMLTHDLEEQISN